MHSSTRPEAAAKTRKSKPAPFQENPNRDPESAPKNISKIRQAAREWAFGDAFMYDPLLPVAQGQTPSQWRKGTYQFDFAVKMLPNKPFHAKGINVAMFDAHVEWQRPWQGTINPQ